MIRKQQLIWVLAIVIILQIVWLDIRLKKLNKQSSANLYNTTNKQLELDLQNIPEPDIKKEFVGNGKLWLEPTDSSFFRQFTLSIMTQSNESLKKADLRLFYPSDLLKVVDDDWQAEEGIAFWSGPVNNTGLIKTITFQVLRPGKANIEFDFSRQGLFDCNLFNFNNEDVLNNVVSGQYEVN